MSKFVYEKGDNRKIIRNGLPAYQLHLAYHWVSGERSASFQEADEFVTEIVRKVNAFDDLLMASSNILSLLRFDPTRIPGSLEQAKMELAKAIAKAHKNA